MFRARKKRSEPAGSPTPPAPNGRRIACVVSRYHENVTGVMLASALETLAEGGWTAEHVRVIDAPGAFELPVIAQRVAWSDEIAAVLCFGLVLKGETEHDVHIATACAQGLMRVALEECKPVLFGVLTCATLGQAEERARRAAQGGLDKGREVARAALAALAALEAADAARER